MGENVSLVPVGTENKDLLDKLEEFMAPAFVYDPGDWDWAILVDAASKGHVQLWAVISNGDVIGGGATSIKITPKRRILEIICFGAAKGSNWEDLWLPLKIVAESWNCAAIQGQGRKGWPYKLNVDFESRLWEVKLQPEESS